MEKNEPFKIKTTPLRFNTSCYNRRSGLNWPCDGV